MSESSLPRVVADGPLATNIEKLLEGQVQWLPWSFQPEENEASVDAIYTYGHPTVDGEMLDRFPGLKVISNYGVGVDHIDLAAARQRGIPVGNTPGILNGATADMAWTLLLATARRLVESDRYARGPDFTSYDPGLILGREVHGATLGILGMGRIGEQIARRGVGFEMQLLYHNRRQRPELESQLQARYVDLDTLLAESDYLVLSLPLNAQTRGILGAAELQKMKRTASLINVSRGAIVDTEALTRALANREIYAAGLDVTEPEPLPRNHPMLRLPNVIIAPHLGSATEQTRQKMAELSVENLRCGLAGKPLQHQVGQAT